MYIYISLLPWSLKKWTWDPYLDSTVLVAVAPGVLYSPVVTWFLLLVMYFTRLDNCFSTIGKDPQEKESCTLCQQLDMNLLCWGNRDFYSGSLGHCLHPLIWPLLQTQLRYHWPTDLPIVILQVEQLCTVHKPSLYISPTTVTVGRAYLPRNEAKELRYVQLCVVCGMIAGSELLSCMIYLKYKKHWTTTHSSPLFVLTLQPTKQPLHNNVFRIIQYVNEGAQMIYTCFLRSLTWHSIKTATAMQGILFHRSLSAEWGKGTQTWPIIAEFHFPFPFNHALSV